MHSSILLEYCSTHKLAESLFLEKKTSCVSCESGFGVIDKAVPSPVKMSVTQDPMLIK